MILFDESIDGWRGFAKDWLPPALIRLARKCLKGGGNVFEGDYSSWEEAKAHSTGYELDEIFQRVRAASLEVKSGEAVFERDSVCFYHEEFCWPLLAGLLWSASCKGNRLNLLDFGGSLGSSFFQHRRFFSCLADFSWSVVEQECFVRCGRDNLEDQSLKFYFTIDECIEARHPDTLLLGGVIQYLEHPYDFMREIMDKKFSVIIFDRTPFIPGSHSRLTVQKVPPEIYPASYPAWFFSQESFKRLMSEQYDLIAEYVGNDQADIAAQFKGFIYTRRK